LDSEERALQIKLAQLNARLQVYMARVFGFVAAAVALIIGSYQFISIYTDQGKIINFALAIALLFLGIVAHTLGMLMLIT
jgi:hypothetical protein